MSAVQVLLYGHAGCPGSESARAYFERMNIPYLYRDVGSDPQARAEWKQLGGIATPLVVVGNRSLLGFDPEEFEHTLRSERGAKARG